MKIEKVENLVANLHDDKTEYVVHIRRKLKQALSPGLVLKKFKELLIWIKILG